MQGYTQFGGQRPFGVSLLYAGWDEHYGFQLYQSDPSGNYGGWKAVAIGAGHQAAQNLLKTEYKEDTKVGQGTNSITMACKPAAVHWPCAGTPAAVHHQNITTSLASVFVRYSLVGLCSSMRLLTHLSVMTLLACGSKVT